MFYHYLKFSTWLQEIPYGNWTLANDVKFYCSCCNTPQNFVLHSNFRTFLGMLHDFCKHLITFHELSWSYLAPFAWWINCCLLACLTIIQCLWELSSGFSIQSCVYEFPQPCKHLPYSYTKSTTLSHKCCHGRPKVYLTCCTCHVLSWVSHIEGNAFTHNWMLSHRREWFVCVFDDLCCHVIKVC